MKKVLYVLSVLLILNPMSINAKEKEIQKEEKESKVEIVTLEACVDGDTARFRSSDNTVIKARFLAVDTPETVHPKKGVEPFGKDASNYTCNTLKEAKEIKLEYDNNSEEEDNYGRKLVWVFTDGVLLQESLVSQGYAEVSYLYADYKYTSLLQKTEETAKANKLGIWSIDEDTKANDDSKEKDNTDDKKETLEKNIIDSIVDNLLATVFDFIDQLLENILKSIEDML